MKSKTNLPFLTLQVVMVIIVASLSRSNTAAETILNDNINIEGETMITDENGGLTFFDGTRQTGAPIPSWHQSLPAAERFVEVLSNTSVLDRETGLVWQKATNDETYTWYKAQDYCYKAAIGGRKGWRLPTIDELATLIDKS